MILFLLLWGLFNIALPLYLLYWIIIIVDHLREIILLHKHSLWHHSWFLMKLLLHLSLWIMLNVLIFLSSFLIFSFLWLFRSVGIRTMLILFIIIFVNILLLVLLHILILHLRDKRRLSMHHNWIHHHIILLKLLRMHKLSSLLLRILIIDLLLRRCYSLHSLLHFKLLRFPLITSSRKTL